VGRSPNRELTTASSTALGGTLLLALTFLSAIDPLAVDLYLPAFPQISTDLNSSPSMVQLTLTTFLLGTAIGQLILGPLSDRYGRRGPLLLSLGVCVLVSAGTALAPTIGLLILGRFLQGLTASAGLVISRAIVADIATGGAATRAFNLLALVASLAPIVGPLLGGVLVPVIGWRGMLWLVTGMTVLALAGVLWGVQESNPPDCRQIERSVPLRNSLRVLANRQFAAYTLAGGFVMAVLMAYLAGSPFVYQNLLGFGPTSFGLAFAVNALGLVAASATAARLSNRVRATTMMKWASIVQVATSVLLVAIVLFGLPLHLIMVPTFVVVCCFGFVFGNVMSLALTSVPLVAGTASAVFGAVQYLFGAVFSPLVGVGGEFTAVPLVVTMLVCGILMLLAFTLAEPRAKARQVGPANDPAVHAHAPETH
jgi:MFS transporter, DHA1 family, multidrug resistance protein